MITSLRPYLALALCIIVVSCNAPVSVHEVRPIRPTPLVLDESSLKQAARKPGKSPLPRAAAILDDLRTTYDRLATGDSSAIPEYNYLVARFVEHIRACNVKPWQNEVEIPSGKTRYLLRGGQPDDLNVDERYFIASDTLEFTGEYAQSEAVKEGVGAPLLAIISTPPTEFETFDKNLRYRTVTALIHFDGNKATVELADPFESEEVIIGSRRYPLHANFSDNMSYGLSETRLDKLGLSRLLNPQRFKDTCRLSRLQPYDPKRIPVLMVHGLDSTPATWAPMYFKLMEDERIRETYQFWVFSYSSGYPYPYSASLLRSELDRMNRAFPDHKDIVLIGHSMGSLVSRLMITDVDDKLWRSIFSSPPSETDISGKSRQLLEESLIFNSRQDIDRTIFFSGPHRGAELATSWIGRLGSKLVRVPSFIADTRDSMVSIVQSDSSALALSRAPNSIDTLAPNNRFIMEINKHPIDKHIPFHSVMGDRGKGDTPNSTDGFVAYWSSHLDGAVSEKIVPSHHSSHAHPQGIEEARRILLEHAGLNP